MKVRVPPRNGVAPRPQVGSPDRRPGRPNGLLELQRTAGNAAVVTLLRGATAQRAPGTDGAPEPAISLADAIRSRFMTAPYHLPSVVALIRSATTTERETAFATQNVRDTVIGAVDEEGRATVFSALLEGRPYHPDFESTIFGTYEAAKAEEVSERVNARFSKAVGITRKLDWNDSIDRPLARYWLRLRDGVVREEIRGEEENRFQAQVLDALKTSTEEAESVIGSGLAEHLEAALDDRAFLRSLRDGSDDFDAFARLAEALGRRPPIGFALRDQAAVREAFSNAWTDSEPGPDGHEEGGWIYLNLVTGAISTERADPDASLSKRIQLGYPPKVVDAVLIGTFHTHPIPGPFQGFASDADEELARGWKVPSAIVPGEGRSKWFGPRFREHLSGGQTFPTY
jgi:hypothetical protein